MNKIQHFATSFLIGILLCIFCLNLFGEKIPMNDGAGFDGEFYRRVAENFSVDFFTSGYDAFRIQRIFPFWVVHYAFKFLQIPLTHANLMVAMQLLHLGNLALQIFLFLKLGKILGWKRSTTAVLFACFFFNFPVLKGVGYEPFQTDAIAVTIALASFVLYLSEKPFASVLVSLLGALTWPTIPLCTLLCVCFDQPIRTFRSAAISLAAPVALSYAGASLLVILLLDKSHHAGVLQNILMRAESPLLSGLSLFAATSFLFFLYRKWSIQIPSKKGILDALGNGRWKILIVSLAAWGGIKLFLSLHTNEDFFSSGALFASQVLLRPLKYPLVTLAGHVAAGGIFPLLILWLFRPFSRAFAGHSLGFAVIYMGFLVLSLDSESRHLAAFIPLLLMPLGKVLDGLDFPMKRVLCLVTLQLALSHFYLPINSEVLLEQMRAGNFDLPEAQRYFMNFGAYMSSESYAVWMGVTAFSVAALAWIFRRKIPDSR